MSGLDPDDPGQQEVIYMHSRAGIEGCRCGWADLGRSHAKHVLTVLRDHVAARARVEGSR